MPEVPTIEKLRINIAGCEHPREEAVRVMYDLQCHYGYLSDEAVQVAADLLGMTTLEVEELATFYDFIYRKPVGKYVIHVCDGVVCWMYHENTMFDYLCQKLGVGPGEVTPDGMFTVLPTECVGYCEHAPALLINGKHYGPMNWEKVDQLLEELRSMDGQMVVDR